MSTVDERFAAWLADFQESFGREPSQSHRMAAYGYLLRDSDNGNHS